jgi:hypothetical protein
MRWQDKRRKGVDMKKVLLAGVLVLVCSIGLGYAGDNFVTSKRLKISDVEKYLTAKASDWKVRLAGRRGEKRIDTAKINQIYGVHQEGNKAEVHLEMTIMDSSNIRKDSRAYKKYVITHLVRFNSGKWFFIDKGQRGFLTK